MKRYLLALMAVSVWAVPILAQTPQPTPSPKPEDETVTREEVIVVSATRQETTLVNAPATLSVVTAETIESSPAQNYGDLLRSTPGVNVIQTSARDINITARQSTNTLTNSQLVLLDGRSIYLDFFGLVLWDFVPQTANEIKQIEVVRGPASVVWGANALTGVINIITKSPRENEGFGLNLSSGLFGRNGGSREDDGAGYNYGANFSFSKAPNDKISYRLSAGYFNSDPLSRPVGFVPLDCHPLGVVPCRSGTQTVPGGIPTGGAPYPPDSGTPVAGVQGFPNQGTSQPKVDLRLDQELGDQGANGRLTYQGGYAGTDGIIHTGQGPFDIQSGSYMAYGKVQYTKSALKVGFFANLVDAEAPNLLFTDPATLGPLVLDFKTQTYDFEVGNTNVIAGKHILTYGANYRRNNFDISITPNSEDRNEFGAYFQEEFFVAKFRLSAGIRADKFGNLEDWVFSPRLSLMFKPTPSHSIRGSYNRAFRSPSVINNYLRLPIQSPTAVDLRPLTPLLPPQLRPLVPPPFFLTIYGNGNVNLREEYLDAFELAYTGTFRGRTTVGLAVYRNKTQDSINFTDLRSLGAVGVAEGLSFYSPTDPATGISTTGQPVTVSPFIMGALLQVPPQFGGPIRLPKDVFKYLNFGPIRNDGLEFSIEHYFDNGVSIFGNYSYQSEPEILDPDSDQLRYPNYEPSIPPENRFNAGISYSGKRFLANANVNYADSAFWTDVLNEPYWGRTESYTMVNAAFGVKWAEGKIITSLKGTNIFDEKVQQQIFGDILRASVVLELRFFWK